MTIEIRTVAPGEMREVIHLDATIFGYADTDEIAAASERILEPSRTCAAFDGGRVVGTASVMSLELTVPGGAQVPMAGVTWVGVAMTHRRRGIMRRLMTHLLAGMEGGREPVAGLGASESLLYHRFGFGLAEREAAVQVDTRHAAFREPLSDDGTLEYVDLPAALDVLPGLHDRMRLRRNGMISRTLEGHRFRYRDADREEGGASPVRFVVHRTPDGQVDGMVSFRLTLRWTDAGVPDGELRVAELLATTEVAELALWRLCLDHDLVRRLRAPRRPLDETVVARLSDPRQWVLTPTDGLYLRPTDPAALLAARRYAREDSLVLDVRDPMFPWAGGTFRLEGGLEGATCTRVDDAPDLVLDTAALGGVYLGDAAVEHLARAGRVQERTAGAVRRATAMFAWSPAPWMSYMF